MESKLAQIKSELIQLVDKWTKSAKSKMSTAKNLYSEIGDEPNSDNYDCLSFAATCQINCAKDLENIYLSLVE